MYKIQTILRPPSTTIRGGLNPIQNCSFELNCQSNAANSIWNSILNQMIKQTVAQLWPSKVLRDFL